MRSRTIQEAIENEEVQEFLASIPEGKSVTIGVDRIQLPPLLDGRRRVIRGLNSNKVGNLSRIVAWENFRFEDCKIPAELPTRFRNCIFLDSSITVAGSVLLSLEKCDAATSNFSAYNVRIVAGSFERTRFFGQSLAEFQFVDAKFNLCTFDSRSARNCSLLRAEFFYCTFLINGWAETRFQDVTLQNNSFPTTTVFSLCSWDKIRIDRATLESLGVERGGISDPELRRHFTINDPIAEMRSMFGGWRRMLHIGTIALFLLPYVSWCLQKYAALLVHGNKNTEWLLTALLRHSILGDQEITFQSVFTLKTLIRTLLLSTFLLYNLVRLVLLVKTKNLEDSRVVHGIWPEFSLNTPIFPQHHQMVTESGIINLRIVEDADLSDLNSIRNLSKQHLSLVDITKARAASAASTIRLAVASRIEWIRWSTLLWFTKIAAWFALLSAGANLIRFLFSEVPK